MSVENLFADLSEAEMQQLSFAGAFVIAGMMEAREDQTLDQAEMLSVAHDLIASYLYYNLGFGSDLSEDLADLLLKEILKEGLL